MPKRKTTRQSTFTHTNSSMFDDLFKKAKPKSKYTFDFDDVKDEWQFDCEIDTSIDKDVKQPRKANFKVHRNSQQVYR